MYYNVPIKTEILGFWKILAICLHTCNMYMYMVSTMLEQFYRGENLINLTVDIKPQIDIKLQLTK